MFYDLSHERSFPLIVYCTYLGLIKLSVKLCVSRNFLMKNSEWCGPREKFVHTKKGVSPFPHKGSLPS